MNTKNIILRLTAIFVVLFAMNSCEDILDEVPSDKIGIERILSKNSIENFRNNSYNNLNATFNNHFGGQLLEVYGDDAFRAGTGERLWTLRLTSFPPPELDHIRYLCVVDGSAFQEATGFEPARSFKETVLSVDDPRV